ncbi:hypothetical protein IW261DRAFT_1604999 [Armillaria novae-zelandiae]|uniref:Uncharacterized protein n=1 Tax=Armillaria novae-zelandiae TaxID=153914 RepID=A0AA39PJM9_9AGAR|nr:hypothetical protein IW261DRAFT_1604999 [Armillaria novae-zelandiae]
MPLIFFLEKSIRQKAANTSRAHLLESTVIVRGCRIITQDKNLTTSSDAEKILSQALKALAVANEQNAKEQDIVSVYDEAITAILSVKKPYPDGLDNIRESMKVARSKDKDVQVKKSWILKRSKRSVPDKSPTIKVDVRVREDIKDEASQKMIPVSCRRTDTLDMVLLMLVLQKGPPLRDNPHFYDKSLLDDIASVRTMHKRALPFDSILQNIQPDSKFPVLYCLRDHKSGNFILLRSVEMQSFANIWRVDVNKYILKGQRFHFSIRDVILEYFSSETIGDLRSADWIISRGLISDVKITKKSISANSKESEVRKDTWLDFFAEVYEDFKWQDGDMCWSIEAKLPERAPLKSIARAHLDSSSTVSFQAASETSTVAQLSVPPRVQGRLDSPSTVSFQTVASETSTVIQLSVPPHVQGRLDSPSTVSFKTVTSETQTVVGLLAPPPATKSNAESEGTKSAFSLSRWVKDVVTSAVASAVGVSKPS